MTSSPLPIPEERQQTGNLSLARIAERATFNNDPVLYAKMLRVLNVEDFSDKVIEGLLILLGRPCMTYGRVEMARALIKTFDMEGPYDILTQILFFVSFPLDILRFFYSCYPERKPANVFVKLIDGEDSDKMAFALLQVEKIYGEISTDTYYELFNYSLDKGNRTMTKLIENKIRENNVYAPIPDWVIPNEAPDTPPEPEDREFIMPNDDDAIGLVSKVLDRAQFEAEYKTDNNLPPTQKEEKQPSSVQDARLEEKEEEQWETGENIELETGLPGNIPPPPREEEEEIEQPTVMRTTVTEDELNTALLGAYRKLPRPTQEALVELSAEQQRVYELERDATLFRYYGPSNFKLAGTFIDKRFVCYRLGCRAMTCVCSDADEQEEIDIDIGEIDWFKKSCDRCFRLIRSRFHAIRLPPSLGGYSGCFCSEYCVKTWSNENGGTEIELALIDLDIAQLRKYGIWDRPEKPIFNFYSYPEQNWNAGPLEIEFEQLKEPTTTEDPLSKYIFVRTD